MLAVMLVMDQAFRCKSGAGAGLGVDGFHVHDFRLSGICQGYQGDGIRTFQRDSRIQSAVYFKADNTFRFGTLVVAASIRVKACSVRHPVQLIAGI